jgi:hypothetical protein
MMTARSALNGPYRLMRAARRTPQRRLRAAISTVAAAAGAIIFAFSSGVGITFLAFGFFAFTHLAFDIAIASKDKEGAAGGEQPNQAEFLQFVDTSQTAVITAAATILGLITAFSGGALPGAAKVAVVGLGGGVLVLFVSRSSQARLASAASARLLGTYADVIGFSLFTLGIIGIVVSLLITGGLGVQGGGH